MQFLQDAYLKNLAGKTLTDPSLHMRFLLEDKIRCQQLFHQGGGMFLDLSRQHLCSDVLNILMKEADQAGVQEKFAAMMAGKKVNTSEDRAALHTAARNADMPVRVDGQNIARILGDIHGKAFEFSSQVHDKKICGSKGKPFSDVLVLGIGGSRLGTQAVYEALNARHNCFLPLHFLSTVDPHAFIAQTRKLNPASTLVLVVSKSFTTREVVDINLSLVRNWLENAELRPSEHIVHITGKGSPGDNVSESACLRVFHIFDFIGGRYSVTSAVGSLPLSLAFGPDVVKGLLAGCREMDTHAATSPADQNLPLLAALCDIWNGDYLGFPAFAMIPYAAPLQYFPAHMQQLYMESLGKGLSLAGQAIPHDKGAMFCFGDTGTDAQHSFFQMLHQGRPLPLDLIGILQPPPECRASSEGSRAHEELWTHLLAQADAFALGRTGGRPEQLCPGNRPVSIITLKNLMAEDVGHLLAFLEARTVYTGFLKNLNPFDQFGVENGKIMASELRKSLSESIFSSSGTTGLYLKALKKGDLSLPNQNGTQDPPR
ncbi:glucose-6-phosphate isomerase [Desulfobotulus alkaliphilus]|uniref:Glucose-6-phosphate isomerase n=1 Tax=Desulfobotulus alkaliphilus TaxID=622671 RepID=A0A562RYX3_9BACT|nr:glucose-6-phosphate isomerase [Desulfobotulus alkaliphilus]TWI74331.1 glucose-6-phosphate isomerase [Desulfobotulus alkaliphilus]